jgi:secernin
VNETAALVLSQPWWMWGAEMGANEHSVVIGNEAVGTLEPLKRTGLLGMDLLRLGLERGKSAKKALNVITSLLEKYGQGGGCAYNDPGWMYHNSFIIADTEEAYVLETADQWWIVEKVKTVRSISNGITIRGKGDFRRKGIVSHAIKCGYCMDDNDFDFASNFSGSYISDIPSPFSRGGKSSIMLNENKGKITPRLMMQFLREHEAGICMHGGFESTGSQVSHLIKGENSIHWFTGSTLPCVSNFKPYTFPIEGQVFSKPGPYSKINPDWFWSKHSIFVGPYKGYSMPVEKKKYLNSLKDIENKSIDDVNSLISRVDQKSDVDFVEKIKSMNQEAYEEMIKLLNS